MSDNLDNSDVNLKVFGYGGLLWKPDFEYSDKKKGYIKGYLRRMWQGSVEHRGTTERMGRCATLIPTKNPEDKVWGMLFTVKKENDVAEQQGKLDKREIKLGRYEITKVEFFPCDTDEDTSSEPISAITYIARETNDLFWKEENIDKLADDIIRAKGFAGPNIDYVMNLADYVRNNIPEDEDQHLFDLESKLKSLTV